MVSTCQCAKSANCTTGGARRNLLTDDGRQVSNHAREGSVQLGLGQGGARLVQTGLGAGHIRLSGSDDFGPGAVLRKLQLGLRPAHLRLGRRDVGRPCRLQRIDLCLRLIDPGLRTGDVGFAGALLQVSDTGGRGVVVVGRLLQRRRFGPSSDIGIALDPVVRGLGL